MAAGWRLAQELRRWLAQELLLQRVQQLRLA
jgi:hypothetical protein